MATVIHSQKALAVNPLKVSQPMGATLAFLGLARAIPLMHGAQGCTAFGKVFFANHFREPIPLQTTAMDQVASILGVDESVVEALRVLCANERPEAIGLLTTGLSETQGADISRNIKEFRKACPEFADVAIIPANTTDTLGCLETGFAIAVEAMIDTLIPRDRRKPRASRVNVLGPVDVHFGVWDSHGFANQIQGLKLIWGQALTRRILSEAQWVLMQPHCLGQEGQPGQTGGDTRLFLEAVLWIARTGARGGICRKSLASSIRCSNGFAAGFWLTRSRVYSICYRMIPTLSLL